MNRFVLINDSCAEQMTDAVVNAANNGLWEGAGICGAIFKKAGSRELARECSKYKTPLKDGEAVITSACNMKNAKAIIHAVGPDFRKNSKAFLELFNAYYNSLCVLKNNGLHSIAFPLISAGIFAGKIEKPAAESSMQCISAYKKFVSENPDYEITVSLCAYSAKEYKEALEGNAELSLMSDGFYGLQQEVIKEKDIDSKDDFDKTKTADGEPVEEANCEREMEVFNDYTEFGGWIRDTRLKLGFTQKVFAEKVNCTIEHLSKVENGHRIPSRLMVETVLDILGYEPVLAVRKKTTESGEVILSSEDETTAEESVTGEIKENCIRVSAEICINGVNTFFYDDIEVSEDRYNSYRNIMNSVNPDDDDFIDKTDDLRMDVMDDIEEPWGIDWSSDNEYSFEYFEIYNPNITKRLKELYSGKEWKREKEKKPNGGWIDFAFRGEFVDRIDCYVTLPVYVDNKGIIRDIKDPIAKVNTDGVQHEVLPRFNVLVDAMEDAVGSCPNLLYELERMRSAMICGDEYFYVNAAIHLGKTLDEACEEYKNL